MKVTRVLIAAVSVTLLVGVGACKKSGDKKSSKGDDMSAMGTVDGMGAMGTMDSGDRPKLSHKDHPKAGDSCKGLSVTAGQLACDGNTKIFCSSYSKYKWKKLKECPKGTRCVVSEDGKSASCK